MLYEQSTPLKSKDLEEHTRSLLYTHINWLYSEHIGATTTDLLFEFDLNSFQNDLVTAATHIAAEIKKNTGKEMKISTIHQLLIEGLTDVLEDFLSQDGRYIDRITKDHMRRQYNISIGREALKRAPHPGQDTLF